MAHRAAIKAKLLALSDAPKAGDNPTPILVEEALRLTVLSSRASGVLFIDVPARVLGIVHESNYRPASDGTPFLIVNGRVLRSGFPLNVPPPTPYDDFCISIQKILAKPEMQRLSLCAGANEVIAENYVMTKVGQEPDSELPLGQILVLAMARTRPEGATFRDADTLFSGDLPDAGLEVVGFVSLRPNTENGAIFSFARAPDRTQERLHLAFNATKPAGMRRGQVPFNRILDLDVICTAVNRANYAFTGRRGANVLGNMLMYTLFKELAKREAGSATEVGEGDKRKYLAVVVHLVLYDQTMSGRQAQATPGSARNPLYKLLLDLGFVDLTAALEPSLKGGLNMDYMVLLSSVADQPLGDDPIVINRLLSGLRGNMGVDASTAANANIIPFADICPGGTKTCRNVKR